jgi:hypothetical protein
VKNFLRRVLPHWMQHSWEPIGSFVAEGRLMERQRCPSCDKTRVTRDI